MSYILDALKKMEHEKDKKTRKAGMSNISGELFRDARPQSGRGGAGRTIALVVATSLVAIGATWYLLRPVEKREDAKPRPVSAPVASVAVAPPPAPVALPALPPPSLPPATPPVAAPKPPPVTRISPNAADSTLSGNDQEPDERRNPRRRRPVTSAPEQLPAASATSGTSSTSSTSGASGAGVSADIRVSGIAWQDERRARRAVVNGFLMKEGGVVAGAKIVEILQDRVRFSQSGRDFELSLVVAGAPAAAK